MSQAFKRKNSLNLMNELTAKLLDNKLMERYGTSLAINMGGEYQKQLNEKYIKLTKEFNKINKDDNVYISRQELADFINTYTQVLSFIIIPKY